MSVMYLLVPCRASSASAVCPIIGSYTHEVITFPHNLSDPTVFPQSKQFCELICALKF